MRFSPQHGSGAMSPVTMSAKTIAGADVGKFFLDVAIEPGGRTFRVPNNVEGVTRIVQRLQQHQVTRLVLEAVGYYGILLSRTAAAAGIDVNIVKPNRVKGLREAEGGLAKTDRLDAGLIARFGLLMHENLRPLPSAEAMRLRALSTRRRQLCEMIAMEKTRLKQAFDADLAQSCRDMIKTLEDQRTAIQGEIDASLEAKEDQRVRRDLLRSIPGVGPVIAATLIVDLPELGTIDRKAIASLAGVAPHIAQSGRLPGKAHIRGGRPCVRVALYLAALSAVRCDAGFKARYQAMKAAGKPSKVALIAIARQIVVVANTMLKDGRAYAPVDAASGRAP